MDSPKRKAQKNKDYRRHRMMRLLNRRKATAQEAMSEIAERQLMRRLRITPPKKFEDGKDAEYDAGVLDDVVITGHRRPANIMFDKDTGNYYRESTGDVVTPVNKLVEDDPSTWSFTDRNGTTFTPHGPVFNSNQGEIRQAEEAPFLSNNYIKQAAHNYMSELAYDINNNRVVSGKYTMPAIALAPVLSNPVGEAAINSAFGAHGLNHAINEGVDGFGDAVTTGLELIPLSQLAKPVASVVGSTVKRRLYAKPRKITAENAASMTPEQWTTAQDDAVAKALNITPKEAASLTKEQYEAAIAKGVDTEELSRLRLLHNSVKAPNNKVRTDRGKGKPFILDHNTDHEPWNVYDDSYFGETDEGWFGKGLYLSGSPFGKNAYGKNKMKLLVNIENPVYAKDNLEVGLAKQFFNRGIPKEDALKILESSLEPDELDFFLKHKKLITKAIDRVYSADGVIAPLDANASLNRPYSPYHEVVVPDGRKVKSADAVTFDNNGVRIPLGKRDNFNINDIRYDISDSDFESFTIPTEELQTSLNAPINNPVVINGKEYPTMKALMNKVEMIKPDELNAAHLLAQKEIRMYLESPEYRQRLIDNGFDPDKYIPALEHYLGSHVKYGDLDLNTNGVTEIVNGKPEITLNSSVFDTDYDTLVHELAHALTKNLDHSMYVKSFIDARLKDIMLYNEKVLPQLDRDVAARSGISINRLTYLNDPQEIRARMIAVIMDARRKGIKLSEYIDRVKSNRLLNDLKSFLKVEDIKKYGADILAVTPFAIPFAKKNKQKGVK